MQHDQAAVERRRIRKAERKAAGLCPEHGNEKPCPKCWHRSQVKRHRKRASRVEYVDIHLVAERQRWKCSLCGGKIPADAKWPDPKSLSMDHTVPISQGGETSYRNITAAHLVCNMAKGAKALVPEQLRLLEVAHAQS
jgi:5-methylcytosine-specific restriction endonuclease McrA